jgi:3-dehydroquinate synthase
MEKVWVDLGERSYDIVIGSKNLSSLGERMLRFEFSPTIAVISNPTVFGLYGDTVMKSLRDANFNCISVLIPDGEEYKNITWVYNIITELLKNRLDRNSCLIALGGGVIGDITGFVASIYMRGINFVQVPTTLLSQVDSSVGGKTGVNHELGKNMIGTFYQPRLVWIDIDTLKTLPKREILCGIAEIIKYGVIWDPELFRFLKDKRDSILNLDPLALIHIIRRSCEIKADIVSRDEKERGLRAILNYGHTIGHALETETGYKMYLHGEAVAIGMNVEARLSEILGFLSREERNSIRSLINTFGLPVDIPMDIDAKRLISHMQIDKKVEAGELRFILPEKIGRVRIQKSINVEKILLSMDRL